MLNPLRNYVLLDLLPSEAPSKTLVVIQAETVAQRGRVISTGPECIDTTVGQTVLVSRLAGYTVGDQLILPEGSILGYLE